jgi:hypothetical protein
VSIARRVGLGFNVWLLVTGCDRRSPACPPLWGRARLVCAQSLRHYWTGLSSAGGVIPLAPVITTGGNSARRSDIDGAPNSALHGWGRQRAMRQGPACQAGTLRDDLVDHRL